MRICFQIWVAVALATTLPACGGNEDENGSEESTDAGGQGQAGNGACPIGRPGCACYGNDTCNAGLICKNDRCVRGELAADASFEGSAGDPEDTCVPEAGRSCECDGETQGMIACRADEQGLPQCVCDGSTAGSEGEECPDGNQGCPCYGNGTCNADLICLSDTCIPDSSGGGTGGAPPPPPPAGSGGEPPPPPTGGSGGEPPPPPTGGTGGEPPPPPTGGSGGEPPPPPTGGSGGEPGTRGAIGDPCTSPTGDDCEDATCFLAWQGGYCTRTCEDDTGCPPGSHCGLMSGRSGMCLKECVDSAACREPDYECYNRDGDDSNSYECAPLGNGPGEVGARCQVVGDCQGGRAANCLLERPLYKDGYCTQACNDLLACPVGSHCAFKSDEGVGNCFKNCSTPGECRAEGYSCYDGDRDGITECHVAGTGSGGIGDPCEGVWDCAGGTNAICLGVDASGDEWLPGGYCTTGCDPYMLFCPAGTYCTMLVLGPSLFQCVDGCTSSDQCRDGYDCADTHPGLGESEARLECWIPAP